MNDRKTSKRFNPTTWTERLVPILFILILIGLVVTVLIVVLSMLRLTPAF